MAMKIFYKILGIFSIVAALGSCSKNISSGDGDDMVIDSNSRYIQFDPGISTRGSLVTSQYLEADFAVIGYQYPKDWKTAISMATPNVFDSPVQKVTFKDGIYQYSPLKVWTGNYYSFFAYYPYEDESIELFDADYEGSPYIKYTHPTSTDPSNMVDIMTASYIDTHVDASPEVRMKMEHRLSAIDIMARNYYQYTDESDVPHLVTIEITDLTLSLTTYKGAQIYLDSNYEGLNGSSIVPFDYDEKTGIAPTQTIAYKFPSLDINPNGSDDTAFRQISKDGKTLLMIPQPNEAMKGVLNMTYKKRYTPKDENGNDLEDAYIINDKDNTAVFTEEIDLSQYDCRLKEGSRYYIEITFTSDAVSVNILKSDEWDELDDVELEFE